MFEVIYLILEDWDKLKSVESDSCISHLCVTQVSLGEKV